MKSLVNIVIIINIGMHVITGYCHCNQCTGGSVITAAGTYVQEDLTIAGPSNIPFGTVVLIDGKQYEVQDRTAAKYDGRFDIYFPTHQEALNFGKQRKEVYVTCLITEQELLYLDISQVHVSR